MKADVAAAVLLAVAAANAAGNTHAPQPHYLVGLLNYPNSFVPDEFKDHTSGTAIPVGNENWVSAPSVPFADVPGVGFSDMEFYKDDSEEAVVGEFFCLSDNGYGNSDNSVDYPLNIQHLKIQKPFTFRHAETTFEKYTPVTYMGTALIHDPNNFIKWENGADIQVTYKIPDDTWDDYKSKRVLTGRDLDPEGLAVINKDCAVLGDELLPAVLMVNPTTGVVLSPFVRTPDIDASGNLAAEKFLSTRSDKVHCAISDLEDGGCTSVDSSVVDGSEYRKHDKTGGYEGFAILADNTIAAFLEKKTGDTTLYDEPGVRVYRVKPGDCSSGSAPVFDEFLGFYAFEVGAGNIADVSAIPGSYRYVAVIERNGFPGGHMWPGAGHPANRLCIVDLLDVDESMVMRNKRCILNYHNIDDPWDTDGNGIFKYGHTQVTNEALVVVDDHCIVAGTDTNYPWTNQFEIDPTVEFYQEVSDARFMVVCFIEPIFNLEHSFLQEVGGPAGPPGPPHAAQSSGTPETEESTEDSDGSASSEETAGANANGGDAGTGDTSAGNFEDATDETADTSGEDAEDTGDSDGPSSRALKHESTSFWYQGTLIIGGVILAVGGLMLAS